jgi:hypothetical protein
MDFPASPATQGQQISRGAYRQLLALPKEEQYGWWNDYLAIREQFPHFRNWRIWVYIAWAGQPLKGRKPATKQELAEHVLGCSVRAIWKWEQKSYADLPGVPDAIAWVQASPLLRHRRDVYEALIAVATQPDAKGHNDRKLFLEMTGDYRPRGDGKRDDDERAAMETWLSELRQAA